MNTIDRVKPDTILTFDPEGISSHPNHISTHNAISKLSSTLKTTKVYNLITTNRIRKFLGLFDALVISQMTQLNDGQIQVLNISAVQPALLGLIAHWSQFVWFRVLFLLFSRYAYINTWKPLN